MAIGARLRKLLEAKQLPLGLAAIAVLLCAPSLRLGLQADDHYLGLALSDPPWPRSGRARRRRSSASSMARPRCATRSKRESCPGGRAPTSASPSSVPLRASPIGWTSGWWPHHPWLMHVHSLLWFGATIAIAAILYRRLMGPGWVGGLAALVFALDDAHGSPAAWLANRNAVLGTLFGAGRPRLPRPLEAEGLAAGPLPGARGADRGPARRRDGPRDRRLPACLCPLPRSGNLARSFPFPAPLRPGRSRVGVRLPGLRLRGPWIGRVHRPRRRPLALRARGLRAGPPSADGAVVAPVAGPRGAVGEGRPRSVALRLRAWLSS